MFDERESVHVRHHIRHHGPISPHQNEVIILILVILFVLSILLISFDRLKFLLFVLRFDDFPFFILSFSLGVLLFDLRLGLKYGILASDWIVSANAYIYLGSNYQWL